MTEANFATKIDKTELIAKLKAATKPSRDLDADICQLFGYEVREHSGRLYYEPMPNYSWQEVPKYSASVDEILKLFEEKSVFGHNFRMYDLFHNAMKALNFKYHWATSYETEEQRRELPIQMMLAYLDRPEKQTVEEYLKDIKQLEQDLLKCLGKERKTEE